MNTVTMEIRVLRWKTGKQAASLIYPVKKKTKTVLNKIEKEKTKQICWYALGT